MSRPDSDFDITSEDIQAIVVATPLDPEEIKRREASKVRRFSPTDPYDINLEDPFQGEFAVTADNLWYVLFYYPPTERTSVSIGLAPPGEKGLEILKREISKHGEMVFAVSLATLQQGHALLKEDDASILPSWLSLKKRYVGVIARDGKLLAQAVRAFSSNQALAALSLREGDTVLAVGNATDVEVAKSKLEAILTKKDLSSLTFDMDRWLQKPTEWLMRQQSESFNTAYKNIRRHEALKAEQNK